MTIDPMDFATELPHLTHSTETVATLAMAPAIDSTIRTLTECGFLLICTLSGTGDSSEQERNYWALPSTLDVTADEAIETDGGS